MKILTVIVILGILFAVGITAYSKYKDRTGIQGYDTMAKSSSQTQTASEYRMNHLGATTINFDALYSGGYLSSLKDPGSKNNNCSGKVVIATNDGTNGNKLDEDAYAVSVCCSNYYLYTLPDKGKLKISNESTAESMEELHIQSLLIHQFMELDLMLLLIKVVLDNKESTNRLFFLI